MKYSLRSVAALVALLASPLSAQTLLNDNFNSENGGAGSVLNYNTFGNWNVTGAVDLIRSSDFGINCVGGSGMCVDMSGSQGTTGTLSSKLSYSFAAGDVVRLSLDVSGNQRGGSATGFTAAMLLSPGASVISATTSGAFTGGPFVNVGLVRTSLSLASGAAFGTGVLEFLAATSGTVTVQLSTDATNNVGPILDNVSVVKVPVTTTVPEPSTYALMAAGLSALVLVQRRRRTR
jgi:hypothetical protein